MLNLKKEDICFMSACEMAEKIRTQELTSLDITEIIIERIEKLNPIINAYCTPTFDLAREMAKKADDTVKKGNKLGLLHGIPISIKDETETKGIRTTFGSKIFENNKPRQDAPIVRRIKEAGCVILGKTNTPAFGYKGETDNLIFGATKNPWNLKRTPGGSSGGAAAAVASGMGPLAVGSDGGGSIRIPSCFCNVYGLKATFGRIPQTIMQLAGSLGTLSHSGPIVRYVKDAALMLDAVVGEDDSDRYSLPKPNYSYLDYLNEKPNNLKIAYSLDLGFADVVDNQIKRTVVNAVQKFEKFDWSVQEARIKLKNPESIMWTFWTTGFAYLLNPFLNEWKDKMEPDLVEMINVGLKYSMLDFKVAEIQREMLYLNICNYFKKFDLLITPTLACPAFELGKSFAEKIDSKTDIVIEGKKVGLLGWLPFTYPFNFSGHPAASIPCGWTSDGLPIGMQIIGRRLDELTVLQVSKAFEEIQPWQDKKPKFE